VGISNITIEERFALGKISEDLFSRVIFKYREDHKILKEQIEENSSDYSNRENDVAELLKFVGNLSEKWVSSSFRAKTALQHFVFPNGIAYNSKTGQYRTEKINPIFEFITNITNGAEKKESGLIIQLNDKSALVARRGIEPLLPE
jgi:site-specific DNA recombinase